MTNQVDKKVYNINRNNLTKPNIGEGFGRISIPSVGIDKLIFEGDDIIVETSYGKYYYKVSSIDIVNPTDVYVVAPTKYEKITMITCYPFNYFGSAPKRYIVSGDFVKVE